MNISDEAIVKRLVESEVGQKAATDIIRDHHMHRIDLKARIEKLKRDRGELAREHADAVDAARQRLEAVRKAITEAEGEHGQASMAQAQHKAHFDTRIKKLERELQQTAPAVIDEFLAWLGDQASACTATPIIENAQKTDRINTHTSEAVREVFNNAASLRERLEAIRAARQDAEKLKDKVLDNADIELRLQELREGLPVVEMRFSHER